MHAYKFGVSRSKLFHMTCHEAGMIIWVTNFCGTKNGQNLPWFRTT